MQTLTHSWRGLRRAPVFALAAALTLAIGIGATTTVFSVLESILLKPLPYRDPGRLVGVWFDLPGMKLHNAPQTNSSYFVFRRFSRSIEGIAIADQIAVNLEPEADDASPERIRASRISANTFRLLGLGMQVGREFTPDEDVPRAAPVAVISDGLWRRRFAADRGVIGKTLRIDGRVWTIVGVAPPSAQYPDASTQLWLPIALDSTSRFGGPFAHRAIARLKPGVTTDALARELNSLLPRIPELYPDMGPGLPMTGVFANTHASIVVHPMTSDVVGTFGNVVSIAAAAGALLLLISFANVAGLLLTRAESRQRELAVRVALGASPMRVAVHFLGESAILAALGGALGLLLAWLGVRWLVHSGPQGIPRLNEIGIDAGVVLFAIALTTLTAVVCSVVPALRYDLRRLATSLRDGTKGGTTGRDRQRMRKTLIMSQVALATVLVAGGGLLFRSTQQLRRVDAGFDPRNTLVTWLAFPRSAYPSDSTILRATATILDRVRALPGVQVAGVSSKVPLNNIGGNFAPMGSDADDNPNSPPPSAEVIVASGDYFKAMGIPLIAGRTFDIPERQRGTEVIVDRDIAAQRWHDSTGRAAIGRRVRFGQQDWLTVIGVVGAVRDTSLAAPANNLVYVPFSADTAGGGLGGLRALAIVARSAGDARNLVDPIRRAVADVDKRLPPFGTTTMGETVELSMGRLTFVSALIGVTALVALLLAAVGLYGMLAYMVSLRSRELSVRLALGAAPSNLVRLVSGQGVALTVSGAVVGILIFFGASRFIRALLVGITNPDGVTIVAAALTLLAVSLAASWIPARRAARMDPARALAGD